MTTTIFAKDLKQYDKIIIPASTQSSKKELRVVSIPELNGVLVSGFAYRVKNGITIEQKTPFQFGGHVQLEVDRPLFKESELDGYIKVSDLKEYMIYDLVDPKTAYFTSPDGIKYVKIDCLKTYMKKDCPVS